jgi:hypothetical protein
MQLHLLQCNACLLFEEFETCAPRWRAHVEHVCEEKQPDLLVVYFQEVGGSSALSLRNIHQVQAMLSDITPPSYWCSQLLYQTDCDTSLFTALGMVIWIRQGMPTDEWVALQHTDGVPMNIVWGKDPSVKGRKGFMHVQLQLQLRSWNTSRVLHLVNVHLTHDADNLESIRQHTSIYAEKRLQSLLWIFEQAQLDPGRDWCLVGGDFNWRLDGKAFVEAVQGKLDANMTLSITPSSFILSPSLQHFCQTHWQQLGQSCGKQHEFEAVNKAMTLKYLHLHHCNQSNECQALHEWESAWNPTYPLAIGASGYTQKRIPAWCDRILLTRALANHSFRHHSYTATFCAIGDHALVELVLEF